MNRNGIYMTGLKDDLYYARFHDTIAQYLNQGYQLNNYAWPYATVEKQRDKWNFVWIHIILTIFTVGLWLAIWWTVMLYQISHPKTLSEKITLFHNPVTGEVHVWQQK